MCGKPPTFLLNGDTVVVEIETLGRLEPPSRRKVASQRMPSTHHSVSSCVVREAAG